MSDLRALLRDLEAELKRRGECIVTERRTAASPARERREAGVDALRSLLGSPASEAVTATASAPAKGSETSSSASPAEAPEPTEPVPSPKPNTVEAWAAEDAADGSAAAPTPGDSFGAHTPEETAFMNALNS